MRPENLRVCLLSSFAAAAGALGQFSYVTGGISVCWDSGDSYGYSCSQEDWFLAHFDHPVDPPEELLGGTSCFRETDYEWYEDGFCVTTLLNGVSFTEERRSIHHAMSPGTGVRQVDAPGDGWIPRPAQLGVGLKGFWEFTQPPEAYTLMETRYDVPVFGTVAPGGFARVRVYAELSTLLLLTDEIQVDQPGPFEVRLGGGAGAVTEDEYLAAVMRLIVVLTVFSGDGGTSEAFIGPMPAQVSVPAITRCRADIDGNGALNIFDFLAFQTVFSEEHPTGDFNRDGLYNIFDYLDFQSAFSAAC